jgi:uncharacterized protein YggU (UPF0235/DUF167 family)
MLVRVRVKTGVRKESFVAVNETQFTIAISTLPERNEANRRVRALLADYFEIDTSHVRLLTGHHAPQKTFEVQLD